ncbi:hybrid sensor histidine kinase/response regulator [Spirosoma foliorum]|uniref:hybrid sensor histidine kinase/response regulator n=1 Tax=Spirosoma foliorum TaxID=2710596 RepID=UPI001F0B6A6A|nr:ATP-binding protein [Spirosoma foliorum]
MLALLNNLKIGSLLLGLLLWLGTLAEAQPYVAWVKHYGPENGLAHREVNAIFQDRQGFMWFGTKFGLSRFDGKTFTTFTKDRNGLDFDDIQSISQDADGLLWLMGPYGESRITLFNPLNGTTSSFEEKFKKQLVSRLSTRDQRLVGSPDGYIFFTNRSPGVLASYHPKSGLRYVQLPQYKTLDVVKTTSRNTVWVVADANQLIELTAEGKVVHQFRHAQQEIVPCLGQQNAGVEFFYLTTDGLPNKTNFTLYCVDESGNQRQMPPFREPFVRKNIYPICYAFDHTGLRWDGTCLRDSTNRTLLDITNQLSGKTLENRSFFRDRNGGMWLGTSFGVYQVNVAKNHFHRLFYDANLTSEKIAAIRGVTVIGNQVYANLEKFGLYTSNLSGGTIKKLVDHLPYDPMVALTTIQPDKLALGAGNQFLEYDLKTGTHRLSALPQTNMLWTICPMQADRWIAGGRPGLWLIQAKTGQVKPFMQYNQFTELAQSHILHIAPDRRGIFWVCSGTGLYTLDPAKGVTARYWSGGKDDFYLPADSYQHVYQDVNEIYWLATANSGLIRWDRQQHQYQQFRRSEGLANNNIYAVYADQRGKLWLSSDYGIMQFDPVRLTTRTYFVQDGITHNEFNRIAHFQDKAGRLYFGGLNGITFFDPQNFDAEKPPVPLPIRLVSFRQLDNSRNQLIDKTEELVNTNRIVIPPGDQTAVLDFALLNFTDAEKNVYAYQFNGLDNTWTQQTESSLRLGNLPYGTHTLLIKGQAANGQWSANTLRIEVEVQRPVYLQVWFIVLSILLLLAGIWAWLKWRIWNHQQEQLRLQSEIKQATAQIEEDKQLIEQQAYTLLQLDETKSRFFANISHEFRTPLTVILGMASEIKRYKTDELIQRSHRVADLIERNGSNLLRLINQILDLSKLEAGEMHLQPIRADIVSFTRYIAESFHTMGALKAIQVHFQTDAQSLEIDFDKDKLQDILSNLLTNAIKFTPSDGHVYLKLTTQETNDSLTSRGYYEAIAPIRQLGESWLSICVRDTGPGIDTDNLPRIFDRFFQQSTDAVANQPVAELGGTGIGLSLVRELVMLMQGGLAVRSLPGQGAEFVIQLRQTHQAPLASVSVAKTITTSSDRLDVVDSLEEGADDKPLLLLVEDNEDVATYIISCIETDYRISRANNGQAGIDLAIDKIPDLILSDVMMPQKDGFQVCDTLKNDARTSHIPIVLLTARASFSDRVAGLRRGADAYLTKPFQREELTVVLSNLLQSRRVLQRHYSQLVLQPTPPERPAPDGEESLEDQFLRRLRSLLEPQFGECLFLY